MISKDSALYECLGAFVLEEYFDNEEECLKVLKKGLNIKKYSILKMKLIDMMTFKEIGEVLGITTINARDTFFVARRDARSVLFDYRIIVEAYKSGKVKTILDVPIEELWLSSKVDWNIRVKGCETIGNVIDLYRSNFLIETVGVGTAKILLTAISEYILRCEFDIKSIGVGNFIALSSILDIYGDKNIPISLNVVVGEKEYDVEDVSFKYKDGRYKYTIPVRSTKK